MPFISIPIPEVDQNITRPMVLDIVRQIKEVVGLPKAAPVIYTGDSEENYQPGSALGGGVVSDIISRQAVTIEVEEELSEEFFATQHSPRSVELVDFYDPKLRVYTRPQMKQTSFTLRFVYQTTNRSEAIAWRNRAQSQASRSLVTALHQAEYHYFYPPKVWELLHHIYTMREKVAGYGESWDQYVSKHLTSRAVMVAGSDNKQLIAIRETQMRIQGEFDFRAEPEKLDKNTDNGTYSISFTYKFDASRPEMIDVQYPIMVHNQVLEERYIPVQKPDFEEKKGRMNTVVSALHHFEATTQLARIQDIPRPRRLPEFDLWEPDVQPSNNLMAASLLTTIVTDNPDDKVLLNLGELNPIAIDIEILDFIREVEHQWVNKLYGSLIQIAVYKNECLQAWDNFEVKPNLDVLWKKDKDYRGRYRVVVFFSSDVTKVDYRAIKRTANYPKVLCKLMQLAGTTQGQLNSLLQHVNTGEYATCVRKGGYSRQDVIDSIVWQKTVMRAYVEAWRIEELQQEILTPQPQLTR